MKIFELFKGLLSTTQGKIAFFVSITIGVGLILTKWIDFSKF